MFSADRSWMQKSLVFPFPKVLLLSSSLTMVDAYGDSEVDPILDLSAPLTPIQQETSMLTESLLIDEVEDSDKVKEAHNQLVLLRILGRPYAAESTFWTRTWPLTLLLGGLLGACTAGFLGLVNFLFEQWSSAEDQDHVNSHGKWGWLIVTTAGGLLSALIYQLPGAPKLGVITTMIHDVRELKGRPLETHFVVMASVIALASGAPLGPELAIGAMGSGLATFMAKTLKLDRRTEAGLVQSGLAGSLGGLFLSPIFGVTLVHELSIAGRPVDFLLDTLTASEANVPRDALAHIDHDFMEQVTLGGTAATAAYVVLRMLLPLMSPSSQWFQLVDLGEDVFELWHLAAAIPIGLICCKFGMLLLALMGAFRSLRVAACKSLHVRLNLPKWVGLILFPTIAGLLHGLLSIWNPLLAGTGIGFLRELLRQEITFSTVPWFMATAACKVVSMSMCLGFGLVGGVIFPMIFVGMCVGTAMTHLLPASLTIPCCVCATVGSLVPIPFTLVLYVSFAMSLSVEQIGPVFVATLTAFTLVGGLGTVKKHVEKRIGYVAPEVDLAAWSQVQGAQEDIFQYETLDDEPDGEEDEELTREVRNVVFGSASPGWGTSSRA
jgi:H+/Cl- antiporter ClcA